jgi:hypothetical protein
MKNKTRIIFSILTLAVLIFFIGPMFFVSGDTLKGLVGSFGQVQPQNETPPVPSVADLTKNLKKPDLQISKVYLSKLSNPTVNNLNYKYLADVKIINNGADFSNEAVELRYGDQIINLLNNNTTFGLLSGESYTASALPIEIDKNLLSENVQFFIDNKNVIDEENEKNNSFTKEINSSTPYPNLFFDIDINEISEDGKITVNFKDPGINISEIQVKNYIPGGISANAQKKSIKKGEKEINYYLFEPNIDVLKQYANFEGIALEPYEKSQGNLIYKQISKFFDNKNHVIIFKLIDESNQVFVVSNAIQISTDF